MCTLHQRRRCVWLFCRKCAVSSLWHNLICEMVIVWTVSPHLLPPSLLFSSPALNPQSKSTPIQKTFEGKITMKSFPPIIIGAHFLGNKRSLGDLFQTWEAVWEKPQPHDTHAQKLAHECGVCGFLFLTRICVFTILTGPDQQNQHKRSQAAVFIMGRVHFMFPVTCAVLQWLMSSYGVNPVISIMLTLFLFKFGPNGVCLQRSYLCKWEDNLK